MRMELALEQEAILPTNKPVHEVGGCAAMSWKSMPGYLFHVFRIA